MDNADHKQVDGDEYRQDHEIQDGIVRQWQQAKKRAPRHPLQTVFPASEGRL